MKKIASHIYPLCIAAILLFSCSGKSSPRVADKPGAPDSTILPVYKKPSSGFTDTLRVTGKAAVFFDADSSQLKKIKSLLPAMNYENDVHDCFYQMRNARIELKKYWPGLRIFEVLKARYLLFEKPGEAPVIMDLDKQNAMCGIYIYDPRKQPLFVDMTNIDTELHFYFQ
jgi:hypothetical protein